MVAEQVAKMKDEARTFIKTIINKMSERNPMPTVIARSTDAFDPKVIADEDKDEIETKCKKPYPKIC